MAYDEEAQWWKEDAARLNNLAQLAEDVDLAVDVDAGPPERLNPDGSLAAEADNANYAALMNALNANPRGRNQYTGKAKAADDAAEAARAEQFRQAARRPETPAATPATTPPEAQPSTKGVTGLRANAKGGYDLPFPQEAVRTVPKVDVDDYAKAVQLVSDRGSAHLYQVAAALGWGVGRLAHAAAAAHGLGRVHLRAYEGGHEGLSPDEMRWSFHHEGDRMGRAQLPSG